MIVHGPIAVWWSHLQVATHRPMTPLTKSSDCDIPNAIVEHHAV
jgi:hypothetical protein